MNLPKETKDAVLERSGGICEAPGCTTPKFMLQFCHILHRMMGGRHGIWEKIIHDKRNVAYFCVHHHDILDNRVNAPKLRDWLTRYIKKKINHEEWRKENGL